VVHNLNSLNVDPTAQQGRADQYTLLPLNKVFKTRLSLGFRDIRVKGLAPDQPCDLVDCFL